MEIIKSKHVGCYGVVKNNNKVLLIRKGRGAYKGKLDLPGGGIEYGENVEDTLRREFMEEVGVEITNFKLKTIITHYEVWKMDENRTEDLQHYGIIFDVEIADENIEKIKQDADGRDSLGAKWYNIEELSKEELSPLAMCILD